MEVVFESTLIIYWINDKAVKHYLHFQALDALYELAKATLCLHESFQKKVIMQLHVFSHYFAALFFLQWYGSVHVNTRDKKGRIRKQKKEFPAKKMALSS